MPASSQSRSSDGSAKRRENCQPSCIDANFSKGRPSLGYGMTETNMNTSNPYAGERRPGTVGVPLPGVALRHKAPLVLAILAAVMSTADGLVVSSSQIIANDLYRCTFVPRFAADVPERIIDRRVLVISRISAVAVVVICTAMAWALMDRNVAMIVWIGTGGLMAAFAGPLVVGAIWSGVTKAGAMAGLLGGVGVFSITHGALIDPAWFGPGWLRDAAGWLAAEGNAPLYRGEGLEACRRALRPGGVLADNRQTGDPSSGQTGGQRGLEVRPEPVARTRRHVHRPLRGRIGFLRAPVIQLRRGQRPADQRHADPERHHGLEFQRRRRQRRCRRATHAASRTTGRGRRPRAGPSWAPRGSESPRRERLARARPRGRARHRETEAYGSRCR